MQANNKITDLFNNQKEPLPDDFWASIEPHIPIYEEKKKKPFFLLSSCLAVGVCGIILISVLAYIYFNDDSINKKSIKSQTATLIQNDQSSTTIANNNEVKNINQSKDNLSQSIKSDNKSIHKTKSIQQSKPTTFTSKNENNRSTVGPKNDRYNNNDLYNKNRTHTHEVSPQNFNTSDNKETIVSTPNTDTNTITEFSPRNVANTTPSSQNEPNELKFETMTIIPTLLANFITPHNHLNDKPFDVEYIKKEHKSKVYALEIGYSAGLFKASMAGKVENFSMYIAQRKNTETDFVTHEFSASVSKNMGKRINALVGMRYTNIQTLFDYSKDIEEISLLEFKKGKHIIQSTQTLMMMDVHLGMEYAYRINQKFTLCPNISVAYNLAMQSKGKFLNQDQIVASINESDVYKKSTGLNLESGLKLKYDFSPRLQSFFSISYRHYLSSFSHNNSNLDIRYNGIMIGTGLNYYLK